MKTYTADEVDEMIGRALAREREQPAKDEFKAAYIEAMVASNEAGFSGMSAAETIRELSRMVAEQPVQQEPVAWEYGDEIFWHDAPDINDHIRATGRPLVYGDTPQPQRQPLTPEQIEAAYTPFAWVNLNAVEHRNAFARAVEAIITGSKT